jgi:polyhydroxybutyrate depolymerase
MTKAKITIDGRQRSFERIAPSSPRAGAPLLLALHGTTQNSRAMRSFSGGTLDALAERIGADLVYLDGHRRAWNDARRLKTSAAQKKNVDDVGFVSAVVEHFGRPTIAVGYSNGGQLLHRVLRERHGLLVGAALISAGLPVDDDFTLVGTSPDEIPVLLFHGTADPVVPFEGGATKLLGRTRGSVRSARATAESYAPHAQPVVARHGDIERADWGRVRQVTQFGVGHVIPNRTTSPAPRFVGPSHHDLDAGEEIEEFFGLTPAA